MNEDLHSMIQILELYGRELRIFGRGIRLSAKMSA